jgi:hypothetical protein
MKVEEGLSRLEFDGQYMNCIVQGILWTFGIRRACKEGPAIVLL